MYKVHRFTESTRQYDTRWLEDDINRNGQLVPALLWYDGNDWVIVDGVHRMRACKKLGIELKVEKLQDIPEKKLPEIILSIQLNNKVAGKIQSACEAVIYLDMVKDYPAKDRYSAAKLITKYDKLQLNNINRLKRIKKERNDWFETLRRGDKVTISDGIQTDSPARLVQELNKIDSLLEVVGDEDSTDNSKEFAMACSIVDNMINTLKSMYGEEITEEVLSIKSKEVSNELMDRKLDWHSTQ